MRTPVWVIKGKKTQLRWISVILRQEKWWPELEALSQRVALAAGLAISVGGDPALDSIP
ncbi:MAG: hypothetical protein KGR16_01935 [Verrucomicrobia bacterium]|nr:hypothetical protein [Verrucomicrobiota bacterium]